ncbi:hypothetical protein [uncultured Dysosmobacter sp.]|uniref:phage adaptor protein n=1 Tax=uncultured Dysosmobacter sp. TaxID=2591384 RepID=UPI00261703C4|nr:hypothetical protein [uncultured Dysosmobacter sp.]
MNWKECKLIALQTMFANEGMDINMDDSNQEYLNAMPGKANEAMQQLATVGRPILKRFWIEIRAGAAEAVTEERLVLPAAEARYQIVLSDYCPRFRCLEQLMEDSGGSYGHADEWDVEGDGILVLPGDREAVYTLWYAAYPPHITSATPDSTELELAPEAAALVPLYIAAELYKEDELAMATMFRNEFEDGLQKLQQSYAASGGGIRGGKVRNTTGWW